jgi:hypothetical protein
MICKSCNFCELLPDIKQDLKKMIVQWGARPNKKIIRYQENHELAYILYEANKERNINIPISDLVTMRMNELLDLFIVAQSLQDICWVDELRDRMWQLIQGMNSFDELL